MQKVDYFQEAILQIMQIAKKSLNRAEFCQLHKISPSKLSRVLNGQNQPSNELLDYIIQSAGIKINIYISR